jgi:hypothetical protein
MNITLAKENGKALAILKDLELAAANIDGMQQ